MNYRKLPLIIVTAAMIIACLFVSCKQEAMDGAKGYAKVSVAVADEKKALATTVKDTIASYQYKVKPLFALAAGEPVYANGLVLDQTFAETDGWSAWTDISVTNNKADLGLYTQGNWQFDVRTLNEQGAVIAVGSNTAYLRTGASNNVTIELDADSSGATGGEAITGSIWFGIETNALEATTSAVSLSVSTKKVTAAGTLGAATPQAITWTNPAVHNESYYGDTAAVGTGRRYYEGTVGSLTPGQYLVTVLLEETHTPEEGGEAVTSTIAGQSIGVTVLGGADPTVIKGTMLTGEFVQEGLTLIAPGVIIGSIDSAAGIAATVGTPVTITYNKAETSATPKTFIWSVDGGAEIVYVAGTDANPNEFSYTPTAAGDHTVSVVVFGENKAEIGSASAFINARNPVETP